MKNVTTLNGFAKCENAKEIVNNSSYLLCYAAKAASLHESENVWNAKVVLDLSLQIRYYCSQQTKKNHILFLVHHLLCKRKVQ